MQQTTNPRLHSSSVSQMKQMIILHVRILLIVAQCSIQSFLRYYARGMLKQAVIQI